MFLKTSQRPQQNNYVGVYFLKKLQAPARGRVNIILKRFFLIITIVIKLEDEQNFKGEVSKSW